ncbi:uncharacterized protein LOC122510454 [Leptopilina heterotoma]|uniref:uncharacterized protein LOC122510454 n=1 Tax=Leptopilina heterotoma TaxID=63436 RepID=UPI001CA98918|nr:uncharacterized protein LOC122510454 [Leptopilina heterotoma]XP_043481046.1 uncharacterized protein LOC122510454 [Leptopilina heterotoma]XP_043481047.1 uncharacterized protein LOC122510454 [Leptopilina heterotoma]XP_043481048.1 uncharacterized protein LOC122510454 [Leptopilina heterotoma]
MRSTSSGIVLTLLLICLVLKIISSSSDCNEYLVGQRGIIQTPNFPRPFSVPINCRWIIDASEIPSTNRSIVVYFTQLFAYTGLKFTEYAYYESENSNYGGTLLNEINEANIFQFRWFKTYMPFLVIEFHLERLEGNHVRVLDNLLDVYGFNMTYEISDGEINENSCTVKDCSFSGNCYIDAEFTSFSCVCFQGFSGENCGFGPLCKENAQNLVCRNNGTCRHVGAAAVRCHCATGYTGNVCEIPPTRSQDTDCEGENCILQCSYPGKNRKPCQCKHSIKIYNNRSRYECRIKLSNVTSLRASLLTQHGTIESLLSRQLTKYLKTASITSMEDLKILSVTPSSEVTFHFFGNSQDGDKIREALNRLVQLRRLNEITLESTHFTFQQKPSLRLQSLRINQVNEHQVRLGDQFILSCVAQGSYNIAFTWYKDNMLVNMSKATREIWYRHLPNDGSDLHTSLLTIDKATLLDEGKYTCQVVDWGMQQCKSIYIEIKDESDVKVVPMSATLEKGGNIQLMCITPNMRSLGIGFGWTKNRALLKLEPGSEVWEDLYPAGSILNITNAQKSAIYTCNVALRSMSVRVEVVNRTLIPLCPKEKSWGLEWSETGPGTEALLDCPRHFIGRHASRLCSMKDATLTGWQNPDFSSCLYEPLIFPYNKFRSLTLGYQNTTGSETINELWNILRNRSSSFYPGEGDRILNILAEIELYQFNIDDTRDLANSAEAMIGIINRILEEESAIYNQQKLHLLKHLTQRTLTHWTKESMDAHKHLSMSSLILDMQSLQVRNNYGTMIVPSDNYVYPSWYDDKIMIRSLRQQIAPTSNFSVTGSVIVFRNLTHLMPRIFEKKLDDGSDLKYQIDSRVIMVTASNHFPKDKDNIWVDLQMRHLSNQTLMWNVSCGFLDNSGLWDLNVCSLTPLPEERTVQCLCPSTGIFAVFLTSRAAKITESKSEKTQLIVVFGCGSCLLQCLFSSLIIGLFWWNNRTWLNFLKLQCCAAIIAAMGMFIYAVNNNIPESSWSIVALSLETFLLVAMTAPISQALIIYAELTNIRPSHHLQPTVIAVITGVPILSVLATELIHQSAGWRHESWWLIFGSGVYNIFITCTAMMLLIFGLLYGGVLLRSQALVKRSIVKKESIITSVHMVHRTTVIVCGIIIMEASSVFYINSSSIIFHYVFAVSAALLGFIIFMTYVVSSELKCLIFKCKARHKGGIEEECISDQIKVCSKMNPEVENDLAPTHLLTETYRESRGIAAGSLDMRDYMNEITAYPKSSSVPVKSRFLPEIRIDNSDDINLENYNTSPRKYQETKLDSKFTNRHSIDPYITEAYTMNECCTTFRDFAKYPTSQEIPIVQVCLPSRSVTPECTTTILCSADVETTTTTTTTTTTIGMNSMPDVTLAVNSEVELLNNVNSNNTDIVNKIEHVTVIPDIANTMERKQPDGEEKIAELKLLNCEANSASGMLDRISHDLDYLLNRTQTNNEEKT